MPTYVSLMKWTAEGVRSAAQWRKRVQNAKRIAKRHKGSIKETYLTIGRYDVVSIIEAPDDAALARIILAAAQAGTISTETLRAFPEEEALRIVESA